MERSRNAFTLVELLVVIGIIALLISILLPALTRARAQAQTVQCMSNMRQINVYAALYQNDNRGWCLPANMYKSRWEAGDWYGILARQYFRANLVNAAGTDLLYGAAAWQGIDATKLSPFLTCPSNTRPPYDDVAGYNAAATTPIKLTYVYNRGLGDWDKGTADTPIPNTNVQYTPKKRSQVPNSVAVLFEMAPYRPTGVANNSRFITFTREVNPLDGSWLSVGGFVTSPHGNRKDTTSQGPGAQATTNVLLMDGSVINCKQKSFNLVPNKYLVDVRDWSPASASKKISLKTQHTLN